MQELRRLPKNLFLLMDKNITIYGLKKKSFEVVNFVAATHHFGQKRCRRMPRLPNDFLLKKIFEVENVLLRTLWVKRNAGRGTPAKYLLFIMVN